MKLLNLFESSSVAEPAPGVSFTAEYSAAGAAGPGRAAHLLQHLVQPLQRTVQVQLDPAGGGGHRLPPVLLAPALHEGHPDGAHPGQGVHGLEALVDGLGQQGGELLVVEDLEVAAGRDLTDGGGVPAVLLVAVRRLHED